MLETIATEQMVAVMLLNTKTVLLIPSETITGFHQSITLTQLFYSASCHIIVLHYLTLFVSPQDQVAISTDLDKIMNKTEPRLVRYTWDEMAETDLKSKNGSKLTTDDKQVW